MGNYRFKLSDMIPNAWFYKLRDMNKTKTTSSNNTTTNNTTTKNNHKNQQSHPYYPSPTTIQPSHNHHFSQPRNSFYYTPRVSQFHNSPKFPHFHDPPRKSHKKTKPHRKTIYKPSPKHTLLTESTQQTLQEFFHSPSPTPTPTPTTNDSPTSESTQSQLGTNSLCTTCTCRLSSSTSDIIFDINESKKRLCFSPELELNLTPIRTKPAKNVPTRNKQKSLPDKKTNQSTPARRSLTRVKVRSKSPKLAVSKRVVQKYAQSRKSLSESFAIVKSSFDPHKDFMESMMEMIIENNLKETKDLEELLACYLTLNSKEYHDVIVKAFEQIWFNLPDL